MAQMAKLEGMSDSVQALFHKAKALFSQEYGRTEALHLACAPGRVNLIGEHTDYNDGLVFPIALPQVTVAVGRLNGSDPGNIRLLTTEDVEEEQRATFNVPSEEHQLKPGTPSWANYVKGVISLYPGNVKAFDMVVSSDVPLGGGLSSSASLEVATFTLLQSLFPCDVTDKEKALVCQQAEHEFADMPCGIMDQFISTMGSAGHALLIDCQSLESTLVKLELDSQSILIINCNVKHQLTGSEYPTRRQNCVDASKALSVRSLRYANMESLEAKKEEMDYLIYRRARHVISEISRTNEAVTALRASDLPKFGELMLQSHNSLRDDFEVSCAELNSLVEIVMTLPGVYGSRMTGGGFGGCTVTLCDTSAIENIKREVTKRYAGTPTFIECTASAGARIVTEAT